MAGGSNKTKRPRGRPPHPKKSSPEVIEISSDESGSNDLKSTSEEDELASSRSSVTMEETVKEEEDELDEDGSDPEDEEEEEEVEQPEKPRRKKQKRASDEKKTPEPQNLSLDLLMFSAAELKKPAKHQSVVTDILDIQSDIAWLDFRAEVSLCIDRTFTGGFNLYDDFDVTYIIKRIQTQPFSLKEDAHLRRLIERVIGKKNPQIVLTIKEREKEGINNGQLAEPAQNEMIDDLVEGRRSANPPKSKVPKASDIDPAVKAQNEAMRQLEERYLCNDKTFGCPEGSFCVPYPDKPGHFRLYFKHEDRWSAGMIADPPYASLEEPPEDSLFDEIKKGSSVRNVSPLLERRRAELKAEKGQGQAQPNIVVHNHIPAPYPNPNSAALPTGNLALANGTATMLVPPGSKPGTKLSIADFCRIYNLGDTICAAFDENGFSGTQSFAHTSIEDLKDMKLKIGAIRELQAAVIEWISASN